MTPNKQRSRKLARKIERTQPRIKQHRKAQRRVDRIKRRISVSSKPEPLVLSRVRRLADQRQHLAAASDSEAEGVESP